MTLRTQLAEESRDGVFGFFICVVIVVPFAFSIFTYEKYETLKAPLFMLFIGLALINFVRRKIALKFSPAMLWLFGFIVAGLVASTVLSKDLINTAMGSLYRWIGLPFVLAWIALVWMLAAVLNRERLMLIVKLLVIESAVIGIFAAAQAFGFAYTAPAEYMGYLPRPPSFIGNPNFAAMFLVAVFPLAIWLAKTSQGYRAKSGYAFALFAMLFGLAVMDSRGANAALAAEFAAAFALVFIKKLDRKTLAWFACAALLAFGMLAVFDRAIRPYDTQANLAVADVNIENRLSLWRETLAAVARRPFGYGLGNFQLVDQQSGNLALNSTQPFDDAHDLWLHIAASGGVLAAVGLVLLVLSALWSSYRQINSGNEQQLAALLGLGGFAIAASVNPVSVSCWLLFAVLLAASLYEPLWRQAQLRVRPVLYAAAVALTLFAVWFENTQTLFYSGAYDYTRGDAAHARRYFDVACRLNPWDQFCLFYRAQNEVAVRNFSAADADVEWLIALNSNYAWTYQRAASVREMEVSMTASTRYKESAVEFLKAARDRNPGRYVYLLQLGYVQHQAGQNDDALQSLSESIRSSPTFEAWALVGEIHQQQGDMQRAYRAYDAAYRLQPLNYPLKHQLDRFRRGRLDSFSIQINPPL